MSERLCPTYLCGIREMVGVAAVREVRWELIQGVSSLLCCLDVEGVREGLDVLLPYLNLHERNICLRDCVVNELHNHDDPELARLLNHLNEQIKQGKRKIWASR